MSPDRERPRCTVAAVSDGPAGPSVSIVHDYLTQRGGAERVVLAMARAFPGAPVLTSLYEPAGTFPEYEQIQVVTSPLQHVGPLRRHHRYALPLLATAFSMMSVDADVVVCSSSGWAHGVATESPKVVYCHTPARWLYQAERYLEGHLGPLANAGWRLLSGRLRRWDQRSARSATRYLANSTIVRDRIRDVYALDCEVLPPPHAADPDGACAPIDGVEPGFLLCVGRLLAYKNVDAVIEAFDVLHDHRLVIVGSGPEEQALGAMAAARPNVTLLGGVDQPTLRWLYRSCAGLVTASYEDFGLTPLEAAAFARPTAALHFGGFLDTITEATGVFFERPHPADIARAVQVMLARPWDDAALVQHARRFSEERFAARLREVVSGVSAR